MNKSDKNPSDNETILMALDQISQTIDVMTSVVGRLRTYMQEQESAATDKDGARPLPIANRESRITDFDLRELPVTVSPRQGGRVQSEIRNPWFEMGGWGISGGRGA